MQSVYSEQRTVNRNKECARSLVVLCLHASCCGDNDTSSRNTSHRFRLSVWGASGHGLTLLQPSYLRQPRTTTRRPVFMDSVNEDILIRCAHARRSMALRPRGCAVLLHRFNSACHCLARHIYHDDGFKWQRRWRGWRRRILKNLVR